MSDETLSALRDISRKNSETMQMFAGQYVPTIAGSPQETDVTATPEKSSESGLDAAQQAILNTYDRIGKFDLKRLEVEVLDCGLPTLNKFKTFTKNQGRLITIGAHTSHGKSALLMQIAAYVSETMPVIVHSFEMSTEEIEARLLAAIDTTKWGPESRAEKAREIYASRKLYVSNVGNRSLGFVMSSVFELSKVVGQPGLVIIDYGQQVRPGSDNRNIQRVNEITDISAGLLTLAQQLKCNVVLGAQLNNEVLRRAFLSQDEDGTKEYMPIISDIREGSSFAHDSSIVLMLVRPYVFDRTSPKDRAKFYCLKNRGGELWDSTMKWDGPRTQFYEEGGGSL